MDARKIGCVTVRRCPIPFPRGRSALTLDIFHRQADKLSAACCAQTVNVLNALFLTDGDRTVLTPHYYVYRMYMPHRGGNLLQTASDSPEKGGLPEVMATASEKDGEMTVSLVCTGYASPCRVQFARGGGAEIRSGETHTAAHHTHGNTPEDPFRVVPRENRPVALEDGKFAATLPAGSVSVMRFRVQ